MCKGNKGPETWRQEFEAPKLKKWRFSRLGMEYIDIAKGLSLFKFVWVTSIATLTNGWFTPSSQFIVFSVCIEGYNQKKAASMEILRYVPIV